MVLSIIGLGQKILIEDIYGKRGFGELVLSILHVLKPGEKMTVKKVHQLLGAKDKYNTIMKVMARLAEKKVLAFFRQFMRLICYQDQSQ